MTKRERQNDWVKMQRKNLPLERSIEQRVVERLESDNIWCPKYGMDGWPDRLILLCNSIHVWFEFKRLKFGALTRAQKIRFPKMERRGERIYIIKDFKIAIEIAYRELDYATRLGTATGTRVGAKESGLPTL